MFYFTQVRMDDGTFRNTNLRVVNRADGESVVTDGKHLKFGPASVVECVAWIKAQLLDKPI